MTESHTPSPRSRLQALLAIPDNQRSEEQWDELHELEITLAPGNRIGHAEKPYTPAGPARPAGRGGTAGGPRSAGRGTAKSQPKGEGRGEGRNESRDGGRGGEGRSRNPPPHRQANSEAGGTAEAVAVAVALEAGVENAAAAASADAPAQIRKPPRRFQKKPPKLVVEE